jgi:hypothetical protein
VPLKESDKDEFPWFRALNRRIETEPNGDDVKFTLSAHLQMKKDLVSFRDMVEAIAEHPKYDIFTWVPPLFDCERIEAEFADDGLAQATAAEAKRAVLVILGFLSWWMASVSSWKIHLPEPIVNKIVALELQAMPRRGFLLALNKVWKEANFPLWVRHRLPLFWVWGLFEERDPRFKRLNPSLMARYRDACQDRGVKSLWGDEISHLDREFKVCEQYDRFLQIRSDPESHSRRF